MKIAYLGPAGTFTGQAAGIMFPEDDLIPASDIDGVFEMLEDGLCDAGVVPIENSTEGAVNATLDALLRGENINIAALLSIPIRHNLLVPKGAAHIKKILAHPQALAQCRKYIRRNFPSVELVHCASNGEAAAKVAKSSENLAAIGPLAAAAEYGLDIYAEGIQDVAVNSTSFVQIKKAKHSSALDEPEPKENCRTSIAFVTKNTPGALYHMLGILNSHNINMTKILSRPMPKKPGEYVFFVDIEDYDIRDAKTALALMQESSTMYKFLGSYSIFPYRC